MTIAEASPVRRPVLRWHGGKFRLAPWLVGLFPPHRIYVEPYGGGAGVLLRKPRVAAEVYNDLDGEAVNVFRVLRDPDLAARLAEVLFLTPWSREEWLLSHEPTDDMVEQARRTIARSFLSHGSMHRQGNRTGFRARNIRSTSAAPKEWATYPDLVRDFVERLRGVTIEQRPAVEVILQQDSTDTLFYVDPPYPLESRTSMRWPSDIGKGYAHEMTDADHEQLAEVLHAVEGMVVLSGYRCPLFDRLYGDWESTTKETIADGAKRRVEVAWLNPAAASANPSLFTVPRSPRPKNDSKED